MSGEPSSERNTAYDGELADWFAAQSDERPWNAFIDRPAVLDLIGECAGQRLLDLGAGSGFYTAAMLGSGATSVTAVDGSARLLEHARERLARDGHDLAKVAFRHHDLERPLGFAADQAYDGAVMALVLHHVDDRAGLLRELHRVLRPGGWLVVSTTHPTADWQAVGGSYFQVAKLDRPVAERRWTIRYWTMPLERFLTELLAAGFRLERIVEPRPVEALREVDPERYARLSAQPTLLAVRLTADA